MTDQQGNEQPTVVPAGPPTWIYSSLENTRPASTKSERSPSLIKTAVLAGVISGLLAGTAGFIGASLINFQPNDPISLPVESGDTSPRPDD